jgi:hypothetical protein
VPVQATKVPRDELVLRFTAPLDRPKSDQSDEDDSDLLDLEGSSDGTEEGITSGGDSAAWGGEGVGPIP